LDRGQAWLFECDLSYREFADQATATTAADDAQKAHTKSDYQPACAHTHK